MAAIAEGHFEVAHALLDAGADANATDSLKRTPLMLAISWKQEGLSERLIAAGADVDAKDSCGDPVLTQAIHKHAWQIIDKLLLSNGIRLAVSLPRPKRSRVAWQVNGPLRPWRRNLRGASRPSLVCQYGRLG